MFFNLSDNSVSNLDNCISCHRVK